MPQHLNFRLISNSEVLEKPDLPQEQFNFRSIDKEPVPAELPTPKEFNFRKIYSSINLRDTETAELEFRSDVEFRPIEIKGPSQPGFIRTKMGNIPYQAIPSLTSIGLNTKDIVDAGMMAAQNLLPEKFDNTVDLESLTRMRQAELIGVLDGAPFVSPEDIFTEEQLDEYRANRTSQEHGVEIAANLATFTVGFKGVRAVAKPLEKMIVGRIKKTTAKIVSDAVAFGLYDATEGRNIESVMSKFATGTILAGGFSATLMGAFFGIKGAGNLASWTIKKVRDKFPKASKLFDEMQNSLYDRFFNMEFSRVETQMFLDNIKRTSKQSDREAVPYIIEGTLKAANESQKQLVSAFKKEYAKWANKISEFYDNPKFVENYVNRIWEFPGKNSSDMAKRFTTKSSFLKKRFFSSIGEAQKYFKEQGIDARLKTTDVATLYEIYAESMIKAIENQRFLKALYKMKVDGVKVIQRSDKAPKDYIIIESVELMRAIGHKGKDGQLIISKLPGAVHPEIAKAVKSIVENPFSNDYIKNYILIGAFMKRSMLSFSFFHHMSLLKSAFGAGIGFKALNLLFNPVKVMRFFKYGENPAFEKMELVKDAIKDGVKMAPLGEAHRTLVQRALQTAELRVKNYPGASQFIKGFRKFNDIFDKHLWDYYHTTIKVLAHASYKKQALKMFNKNKKMTPEELTKLGRDVGKLTNNTMGGQAYEVLMRHPNTQQGLQMLILAPDWTESVLKQSMAPLYPFGTVTGALGRRYWLKAGFAVYGTSNAINYANTQRILGEGKFMWDNDLGHEWEVFVGIDDKGRRRYATPAKQFSEIHRYFTNPGEIIGNKLNPNLRLLIEHTTGESTGTIFTKDEFKLPFEGQVAPIKRIKHTAKTVLPLSVKGMFSGRQSLLAFPVKTVSAHSIIKQYEAAIENKDWSKVKEITTSAVNSKHNAGKLKRIAKRNVSMKRSRRKRK